MTRPDDPLEWLYGRQRLGMTLGLRRVQLLLAAAGDPQGKFRSILVGGTNGKGSTARALAECLRAAGERVGLYGSPHLSRIGERFIVDGQELARSAVAEAVAEVRPAAERLEASFFEILTVAGCLLFAERRVSSAVMEVGLGGRFDATNALEPDLSLVTGISLDHVDLLGDNAAAIAREKAGIFRSRRPAMTAAQGEALAVLRDEAERLGAPLWELGREIEVEGHSLGWQGVRLWVRCPAGEAGGASPLVGAHQVRNLALATAAALQRGVSADAVGRGLAVTRSPGRLERVRHQGRWLLFDGAHNAEAASALAGAMGELLDAPCTLVVGLGRDKDLAAFSAALGPHADRVFATRALHSPRARPPEEVAAAFGSGAESVADPRSALAAALEATAPGETVVVAGSLYLVGELRPAVVGEEFEAEERWQ
ncbi:MAG: Mur ligase family protein [Trueperaceae bacterium]